MNKLIISLNVKKKMIFMGQSGSGKTIMTAEPKFVPEEAAEVTLEAAKVFAASKMLLLGNESQSVGPENAPMAVHLALLGSGVVLLEGIRLAEVPQGVYLLNAAPLNLSGADGSPCRAILIEN